MNKKEKFDAFLESLKGNGQDNLIENIKKGYQACFESNDMNKKVQLTIDFAFQTNNQDEIEDFLNDIEIEYKNMALIQRLGLSLRLFKNSR